MDDLRKVMMEDIIQSVTNKDMVTKVMPAEMTNSFKGRAWAVLKILCSFKMKRAMKEL